MVLTEALTAHHDTVLADETVTVVASPALATSCAVLLGVGVPEMVSH